ncbi:uncharacterized protein LOC131428385 [Malaya genurostris]|uniref:uncharacterized protein LOC131428385 n=1 Tax=Malaya genurostris TaxID=325434 RepID=UPI0026F39F84|nr:uncharacterized protein LOC131428385 [Malaya genurostris]
MALLSGARLCVLDKKGDKTNREITIRTNQVKFGSHPLNTIRLKANSVKQLHCKIFTKNEKVIIINYSIENPIIVNSEAILKRGFLSDGSILNICGTRFRWQFDESKLLNKKSEQTTISSRKGKRRRTIIIQKKQSIDTKRTSTETCKKTVLKKGQKTPTYTLPKNGKQLLKNIRKRFTVHNIAIGHDTDDETNDEIHKDEVISLQSESTPTTNPRQSRNNTPFYTPELEKENTVPMDIEKTPTVHLENSAMMILSYTPIVGTRSKVNLKKTPLSSANKGSIGMRSPYMTPKTENISTSNISKAGNSMYLIDLTTPGSGHNSYVNSPLRERNNSFSSVGSSVGLIDLITPSPKKIKASSSAVMKSVPKGLLKSALKNASKTPRTPLVGTPKNVPKIKIDDQPGIPDINRKISRTPVSTSKSKIRRQIETPIVCKSQPVCTVSSQEKENQNNCNEKDTTKSSLIAVTTTDEIFDTLLGQSIKRTDSRKSDSSKSSGIPSIISKGGSNCPETEVENLVESASNVTTSKAMDVESAMRKPNRTTQIRSSQYSDITPHDSFVDGSTVAIADEELPECKDESVILSENELENLDEKPKIVSSGRRSHTPLTSKIVRTLGNKRQTIGNFFSNMFGKLTVSPVNRVSITDSTELPEEKENGSENDSDESEEVYHDSEIDQEVNRIQQNADILMSSSPKLRHSLRDTRKFIGSALTSLNTSKSVMLETSEIDESILLNETYDENNIVEGSYDLTDLSSRPATALSSDHAVLPRCEQLSTPEISAQEFNDAEIKLHNNSRCHLDSQNTPNRNVVCEIPTSSKRKTVQREFEISPLAVPLGRTPKASPITKRNIAKASSINSQSNFKKSKGHFECSDYTISPIAQSKLNISILTETTENISITPSSISTNIVKENDKLDVNSESQQPDSKESTIVLVGITSTQSSVDLSQVAASCSMSAPKIRPSDGEIAVDDTREHNIASVTSIISGDVDSSNQSNLNESSWTVEALEQTTVNDGEHLEKEFTTPDAILTGSHTTNNENTISPVVRKSTGIENLNADSTEVYNEDSLDIVTAELDLVTSSGCEKQESSTIQSHKYVEQNELPRRSSRRATTTPSTFFKTSKTSSAQITHTSWTFGTIPYGDQLVIDKSDAEHGDEFHAESSSRSTISTNNSDMKFDIDKSHIKKIHKSFTDASNVKCSEDSVGSIASRKMTRSSTSALSKKESFTLAKETTLQDTKVQDQIRITCDDSTFDNILEPSIQECDTQKDQQLGLIQKTEQQPENDPTEFMSSDTLSPSANDYISFSNNSCYSSNEQRTENKLHCSKHELTPSVIDKMDNKITSKSQIILESPVNCCIDRVNTPTQSCNDANSTPVSHLKTLFGTPIGLSADSTNSAKRVPAVDFVTSGNSNNSTRTPSRTLRSSRKSTFHKNEIDNISTTVTDNSLNKMTPNSNVSFEETNLTMTPMLKALFKTPARSTRLRTSTPLIKSTTIKKIVNPHETTSTSTQEASVDFTPTKNELFKAHSRSHISKMNTSEGGRILNVEDITSLRRSRRSCSLRKSITGTPKNFNTMKNITQKLPSKQQEQGTTSIPSVKQAVNIIPTKHDDLIVESESTPNKKELIKSLSGVMYAKECSELQPLDSEECSMSFDKLNTSITPLRLSCSARKVNVEPINTVQSPIEVRPLSVVDGNLEKHEMTLNIEKLFETPRASTYVLLSVNTEEASNNIKNTPLVQCQLLSSNLSTVESTNTNSISFDSGEIPKLKSTPVTNFKSENLYHDMDVSGGPIEKSGKSEHDMTPILKELFRTPSRLLNVKTSPNRMSNSTPKSTTQLFLDSSNVPNIKSNKLENEILSSPLASESIISENTSVSEEMQINSTGDVTDVCVRSPLPERKSYLSKSNRDYSHFESPQVKSAVKSHNQTVTSNDVEQDKPLIQDNLVELTPENTNSIEEATQLFLNSSSSNIKSNKLENEIVSSPIASESIISENTSVSEEMQIISKEDVTDVCVRSPLPERKSYLSKSNRDYSHFESPQVKSAVKSHNQTVTSNDVEQDKPLIQDNLVELTPENTNSIEEATQLFLNSSSSNIKSNKLENEIVSSHIASESIISENTSVSEEMQMTSKVDVTDVCVRSPLPERKSYLSKTNRDNSHFESPQVKSAVKSQNQTVTSNDVEQDKPLIQDNLVEVTPESTNSIEEATQLFLNSSSSNIKSNKLENEIVSSHIASESIISENTSVSEEMQINSKEDVTDVCVRSPLPERKSYLSKSNRDYSHFESPQVKSAVKSHNQTVTSNDVEQDKPLIQDNLVEVTPESTNSIEEATQLFLNSSSSNIKSNKLENEIVSSHIVSESIISENTSVSEEMQINSKEDVTDVCVRSPLPERKTYLSKSNRDYSHFKSPQVKSAVKSHDQTVTSNDVEPDKSLIQDNLVEVTPESTNSIEEATQLFLNASSPNIKSNKLENEIVSSHIASESIISENTSVSEEMQINSKEDVTDVCVRSPLPERKSYLSKSNRDYSHFESPQVKSAVKSHNQTVTSNDVEQDKPLIQDNLVEVTPESTNSIEEATQLFLNSSSSNIKSNKLENEIVSSHIVSESIISENTSVSEEMQINSKEDVTDVCVRSPLPERKTYLSKSNRDYSHFKSPQVKSAVKSHDQTVTSNDVEPDKSLIQDNLVEVTPESTNSIEEATQLFLNASSPNIKSNKLENEIVSSHIVSESIISENISVSEEMQINSKEDVTDVCVRSPLPERKSYLSKSNRDYSHFESPQVKSAVKSHNQTVTSNDVEQDKPLIQDNLVEVTPESTNSIEEATQLFLNSSSSNIKSNKLENEIVSSHIVSESIISENTSVSEEMQINSKEDVTDVCVRSPLPERKTYLSKSNRDYSHFESPQVKSAVKSHNQTVPSNDVEQDKSLIKDNLVEVTPESTNSIEEATQLFLNSSSLNIKSNKLENEIVSSPLASESIISVSDQKQTISTEDVTDVCVRSPLPERKSYLSKTIRNYSHLGSPQVKRTVKSPNQTVTSNDTSLLDNSLFLEALFETPPQSIHRNSAISAKKTNISKETVESDVIQDSIESTPPNIEITCGPNTTTPMSESIPEIIRLGMSSSLRTIFKTPTLSLRSRTTSDDISAIKEGIPTLNLEMNETVLENTLTLKNLFETSTQSLDFELPKKGSIEDVKKGSTVSSEKAEIVQSHELTPDILTLPSTAVHSRRSKNMYPDTPQIVSASNTVLHSTTVTIDNVIPTSSEVDNMFSMLAESLIEDGPVLETTTYNAAPISNDTSKLDETILQTTNTDITELINTPASNKIGSTTKMNTETPLITPFVIEETPAKNNTVLLENFEILSNTVSSLQDSIQIFNDEDECQTLSINVSTYKINDLEHVTPTVACTVMDSNTSINVSPSLLKHLCERVISLEHAVEALDETTLNNSSVSGLTELQTPVPATTPVISTSSGALTEISMVSTKRKLYTRNYPDDKTPEGRKSIVVRPVSNNEYLNIVDQTSNQTTIDKKAKRSKSSNINDGKEIVRKVLPTRKSRRNIKSLSEESLAGISPEPKFVKPIPNQTTDENCSLSSETDKKSVSESFIGRRKVMFNDEIQVKEICSPAPVGDIIKKVSLRGRGRKVKRAIDVIIPANNDETIKPATKQIQKVSHDIEKNNIGSIIPTNINDDTVPTNKERVEVSPPKRSRRVVQTKSTNSSSQTRSRFSKRNNLNVDSEDCSNDPHTDCDADGTNDILIEQEEGSTKKPTKQEGRSTKKPTKNTQKKRLSHEDTLPEIIGESKVVENTQPISNVENFFAPIDTKVSTEPIAKRSRRAAAARELKSANEEVSTFPSSSNVRIELENVEALEEIKVDQILVNHEITENIQEVQESAATRRRARNPKKIEKALFKRDTSKTDQTETDKKHEVVDKIHNEVGQSKTSSEKVSILTSSSNKSMGLEKVVAHEEIKVDQVLGNLEITENIPDSAATRRRARNPKKTEKALSKRDILKTNQTETDKQEVVNKTNTDSDPINVQSNAVEDGSIEGHTFSNRPRRGARNTKTVVTVGVQETLSPTSVPKLSRRGKPKRETDIDDKDKENLLDLVSSDAIAETSVIVEQSEKLNQRKTRRGTETRNATKKLVRKPKTRQRTTSRTASNTDSTWCDNTDSNVNENCETTRSADHYMSDTSECSAIKISDSSTVGNYKTEQISKLIPTKRGRGKKVVESNIVNEPSSPKKEMNESVSESSEDTSDRKRRVARPTFKEPVEQPPSVKIQRRCRQKKNQIDNHLDSHQTIEESLNESHMIKTMLPSSLTSTPLVTSFIEKTDEVEKKSGRGKSRKIAHPVVSALIEEGCTTNRKSPRGHRNIDHARIQDSIVEHSEDPVIRRGRGRATNKSKLTEESKNDSKHSAEQFQSSSHDMKPKMVSQKRNGSPNIIQNENSGETITAEDDKQTTKRTKSTRKTTQTLKTDGNVSTEQSSPAKKRTRRVVKKEPSGTDTEVSSPHTTNGKRPVRSRK